MYFGLQKKKKEKFFYTYSRRDQESRIGSQACHINQSWFWITVTCAILMWVCSKHEWFLFLIEYFWPISFFGDIGVAATQPGSSEQLTSRKINNLIESSAYIKNVRPSVTMCRTSMKENIKMNAFKYDDWCDAVIVHALK